MSHYFGLRRMLATGAAAVPAYVIVAPATLQARDSRRFVEGTNRALTLQQSSDEGGVVRLYDNPGYLSGHGGYITNIGYGEEFYFLGTRFVLSGLGNSDGADFDVSLEGTHFSSGSTYDPQERIITYFDSGILPYGLHRVTTYKTGNRFAFFLNQVQLY